MSKFLVTGCAGFIGSAVCQQLLQQGHRVEGVDCFTDAYDVRLKDWRIEQLRGEPGFSFTVGNIGHQAWLRQFFVQNASAGSQFDAVLNLAAWAGVRASLNDPWKYIDVNLGGTLNLLEMCREHSIGKFVLASTSSAYGDSEQFPSSESQATDRPLSPYAASKKAAECMAFTYHHLYGIDVSIPRYFTVYGPAGRPDMAVFTFIESILHGEPLQVNGDGRQRRDMTFVDDVAAGTVAAIRNVGYQIINLGGGRSAQLIDVIQTLESLLGRSAQLIHFSRHTADVLATSADISKAEQLLEWTPQTSLESGLSKTVQWHLAERTLLDSIRQASVRPGRVA